MGELRIEKLSAGYSKDINVVQDVSITACAGKITVILGPNGVGKSTLFNAIYGFITPNDGSLFHNGDEITGERPGDMRRRGIAYIMQRHNIFPYLTVEENLEMGGWILRKNDETIERLLESACERFPILKKKRRHKAGDLSDGEQRMLEIARSLMMIPDLILIDEPTAGLAPKIAAEVYEQLTRLNKEEGRTILMIDQNLHHALEVADYIYVMDLGRIKKEGEREKFGTDLKQLVKEWLC